MLERYLARPSYSTTLPHIAVLQSAPLYVNLGMMLTSLARFKDAIRIYEILINAADTQLSRWDGLVKKTMDDVMNLPKDHPEFQSATELVNEIKAAKIELEASLLTYNHDLGTSHIAVGDYLAAQKSFTKAIELLDRQPQREDDVSGMLNSSISMVYEAIGNYKLAAKHHSMALRSAPTIEKYDHPHLATMLHSTHFLKDTAAERAKLEAILDESDPNWRASFLVPKTREEILDDILKEKVALERQNQPQLASPTDSTTANPTNATNELDTTTLPPHTEKYVSFYGSPEMMAKVQQHAQKESVLVAEVLNQHRKRLAINDIALVPILLQLATLKRRCAFFVESLELVDEALRLVSEAKGHKHAYYATALMHKSIHYHTTGDLVCTFWLCSSPHFRRGWPLLASNRTYWSCQYHF